MLDPLSAIILGIVQGLTEFLPISSSGHLILVREFLGFSGSIDLSVDALLHFATAGAIAVYFRKDLLSICSSFFRLLKREKVGDREVGLVLALIAGTIPAVILGLLLESAMETLFRSANLVAVALVAGSLIMFFGERYARGKPREDITPKKGLAIGFFQSLALIPGMSRSGMTIAGGMALGLSREEAARFGFLLGFPLFIGAGLKKTFELGLGGVFEGNLLALILGTVAAFITGLVVIHYLLKFLRGHSLNIFIFYRLVLAAGIIFLL